MRSIILYTAILGDYDDIKEHNHPRDASFCFTNQRNLVSSSWTMIFCDTEFHSIDERIRAARFYKALSHLVLPAHRFSIWIDASMQINGPIERTINSLDSRRIATFKYPDIYGPRSCAYDEAIACIRRGKDATEVIQSQMQRYRAEGFPSNRGLAETTIIARECTEDISRFNEAWWAEIQCGSRRDQLSFDYTCWRVGIGYAWLPGYRLRNPFATYAPHKEQLYPGIPWSA